MTRHNANTLRAIPTLRAAALVFGSSALDRALGAWRTARDQVPGLEAAVLATRVALGRANRTRPENRRVAQAAAFRALNAARVALRRAIAAQNAAGVALLALGGTLEFAQVVPAPAFTGVRVEDDPDMAAFLPRAAALPLGKAFTPIASEPGSTPAA